MTAVAKANIMKFTDGLFYRVAREVAEEYSGKVGDEERLVDNMCMQLVQKPERYDVLVMPNLYGDILSDLCAGLVGGLGVAPGANIGPDVAVFEPTHGSAPPLQGAKQGQPHGVHPLGMLMRRHPRRRGRGESSRARCRGGDRRGQGCDLRMKPNRDDPTAVGTAQMADAIIRKLEQ